MKRVFSIILTISLLLSCLIIALSAQSYYLGDINHDGKINITDIVKLKMIIKGYTLPTAEADVNGDGKVGNLTDLIELKLIIKGYKTPAYPQVEVQSASLYTVIIPSSPTAYETYAAELLCDYVQDNYNIALKVLPDSSEETENEILIGSTSRNESALATEITDGKYILKKKNSKLVLAANSYMIGAAVGELTYDKMDGDGNIILSDISTAETLSEYSPRPATGVILMIGDGMGKSHISYTEKYMSRPAMAEYGYTHFAAEELPNCGESVTFALKAGTGALPFERTTTDSAASGTAMATGWKTITTRLGMNYLGANVKNVRELAYEHGYKTGVMTTEPIYKATPAAFTAHIESRYSYDEITAQQNALLADGKINYLKGDCADSFLPDVKNAIDTVSTDSNGFFLMIEEAYIDITCTSNYTPKALALVMNRFNQCIQYAMTFAAARPDTVLIVTADHETGGLNELGQITSGGEHTNVNVPLFAIGSGTERFAGTAVANTDIGKFIASIYGEGSFGDTSDFVDSIE